jgi:hypothetical protein
MTYMARISTDILIKTAIEAGIADLRKNKYLLTDIFPLMSLENDPLLATYQGTDYRNALQWFSQTDIKTVLYLRRDLPTFPCISIALVSSSEDLPDTSLGDVGIGAMGDFNPEDAQRPPTKVYNNFTPISYNPATGTVTLPSNLNTYQLAPELHMLVEKNTGRGFVVKKILDQQNFNILPNQVLDLTSVYIAPVSDLWNAHYGRSRFKDTYEIGVHGNSQPTEAIWLAQIVEYILLKYKARLFEQRGIILGTFTESNVSRNDNYQADTVYSRFFNVSFQSETRWIESIAPKIAKVNGGIYVIDDSPTPQSIIDSKPDWLLSADKPKPIYPPEASNQDPQNVEEENDGE